MPEVNEQLTSPVFDGVTIRLNVEETQRLAGILARLNDGMYVFYNQLADVLEAHNLEESEIEEEVWSSVRRNAPKEA